jgi:hypothetical protein
MSMIKDAVLLAPSDGLREALLGDGPCGSRAPIAIDHRALGGRVEEGGSPPPAGAFPDLTDPATVGCLLAMLPPGWRAASEGTAHSVWLPGATDTGEDWPRFDGPTLGEAVARALLAVLR